MLEDVGQGLLKGSIDQEAQGFGQSVQPWRQAAARLDAAAVRKTSQQGRNGLRQALFQICGVQLRHELLAEVQRGFDRVQTDLCSFLYDGLVAVLNDPVHVMQESRQISAHVVMHHLGDRNALLGQFRLKHF